MDSHIFPPHPLSPPLIPTTSHLILTRRGLTSLQLIQIPATDIQTPLVLVHACPETLDLVSTDGRGGVVLHGSVGLFGGGLRCCCGFGWGGGAAAAEETAYGVADGGADCDAAVQISVLDRIWMCRGGVVMTYAAVLAICPNRPEPWLPAAC